MSFLAFLSRWEVSRKHCKDADWICRRDVMTLTLQRVDERYGGVSQYVRDHCSFSAEDVDRIRSNMLCQAL